ncbi:MAG: ComEC/Rec2 family competence protein [Candidatus Nanopelagicales bacterium]
MWVGAFTTRLLLDRVGAGVATPLALLGVLGMAAVVLVPMAVAVRRRTRQHHSGRHHSGRHPSGQHPSGRHPSGRHRSGEHRSGRPRVTVPLATAVVLAGLGTAAGAASAALQVASVGREPLTAWARERAMATLVVRVSGDPRRIGGAASGPRRLPDSVRVRAVARQVQARGERILVDQPVLVSAPVSGPAAGWADVRDGETVVVRGRLAPVPVLSDAAAVVAARAPPQRLSDADPVPAVATSLRRGLAAATEGLDPDPAALVAGLAVGDESRQPADLADAMRASGLSHLTAVSGGNVAIVLAAVLVLARLGGLRTRARLVLAASALAGFVVLVRPQPSVLRAAAMGSVALLATVLGGRRSGVPALAGAVAVLVLVAPPLATSYGFALSVAATGGLVVAAPRVVRRMRRWRPTARWPPALAQAVALAVAAQCATAPLIAALGGGVPLVTVPANVLAAPAVAPVTVLGLAAAVLSAVSPPAAAACAVLAAPFAGWIATVAHRAAAVPGGSLPWPDGAVGGLSLAALAVVALGLAALARRRRARRPPAAAPAYVPTGVLVAAGVALVVVVLLLRPPSRAGWPPDGWVIVACDVGQGDASVVRTGDGSGLLVDAGPEPAAVDRCLRDLGVTRLDAVLTHFHADHVDGLPGALAGRDVGEVVVSPLAEPADSAALVDGWARAAGAGVTAVGAGRSGRMGDARWVTLWPRRTIRGEGSDANNASVVLLLDVAGLRILLTGDVEPAAQRALRAGLPDLGVDVVKVPHHGSAHQDPAFAGWAGARVALVSVGKGNDYGHPAAETLDTYARSGAVVVRTDTDGDIAVVRSPDGALGIVTRG